MAGLKLTSPVPQRLVAPFVDSTRKPNPSDICVITADGKVDTVDGGSTAAAYAVFHGESSDGRAVVLYNVVVSFNVETGQEPGFGDTVYLVDAKTVSKDDATATRPAVGTLERIDEEGEYFVYIKGTLK